MQTKHILIFVAIAILVGAIVSMTTSGVLVAAQTKYSNNDSNSNTNIVSIDSDFVKEGLIDDDDKGTGEDPGTDDTAGEQEDSDDCLDDDTLEADATANASKSGEGAEDADEPGDEDVNDEEDTDTGDEDEGESDDKVEESTTTSSSTSSSAVDVEEEDDEEEDENVPFDACNFSNEINNPYLPLSKYVGNTLTFEGTSTEDGSSVNVKELWNVRSETFDIADVETLVVVVQEFEDGELVQEALQYYAQGKDGVVYNFGEDIADYEDGVAVENDEESWIVGDDVAVPGIAMPATPAVGTGFAYHSVTVPGIAHEFNEVRSLIESVSVDYGSFDNSVLQVNVYDFDDGKTSMEFYASGVGLVKEVEGDEELELISIQADAEFNPSINPSDFVSSMDNPHYTLSTGSTFTYQSETDEGTEKNIVIVTRETKEILGVTTTVVWDRVWLDEQLIEETFDWYAQDKEGNVWYLGEDSTEYEDGEAVSTEGSWEAGVDGAKPGVIMEANPQLGDSYRQEYYPGEAEDMAEVVSLGETVTVPFGTFTDCVKTREWSPIDPELNEYKFHCTELGGLALEVVIDSGERVELVDVA